MMPRLWVTPAFQPVLTALRLHDAASIRAHFEAQPAFMEEPTVRIVRTTLSTPAGEDFLVFFKEYRFKRPDWRFALRASKARREFVNAGWMRSIGLPAAEPLLAGEERDRLGRLTRAFILTRAIEGAVSLDRFAARSSGQARAGSARDRRAIITQLAGHLATMHHHRFAHNDLHWRNVLIERAGNEAAGEDQPPRVWFIDCPRGRRLNWSFFAARKFIKDFATLHRTARSLCSPREAVRFVRTYRDALRALTLNRSGLAGWSSRDLLHAIEHYHRRRWPEDYRRPRAADEAIAPSAASAAAR